MSDRPENNSEAQDQPSGGWRQPTVPNSWRRVKPQQPDAPTWRRLPALPQDVPITPAQQGGWHRPAPNDTLFDSSSEVAVRERARPAQPTTTNLQSISPEDLIAEITQRRTRATGASAAAPEDLQLREKVAPADDVADRADNAGGEAAGPAPEDLDFGQQRQQPRQTTEAAPEDLTLTQARPQAAPTGPAPEDLELTQAQRTAATPAPDATDTADDIEVLPYDQIEATPTTEAASILPYDDIETDDDEADDDDNPFSMGELTALLNLERESSRLSDAGDGAQDVEADDLSQVERALMGGNQPQATAEDTAGGVDPAEYARQAMAALRQDQTAQPGEQAAPPGATPVGEATQRLSPAEQQLAQRFRQAREGVLRLVRLYENREISYNDLQAQRGQYTFQDYDGNWWAYSGVGNTWFKRNPQQNEWVEAEPPVSPDAQDGQSPPTVTGDMDPVEVLPGSLPILQETGRTGAEYDPTGEGGTPVPRPGQPQIDENATIVGRAAYTDNLPDADQTVQNMRTVQAPGSQATVQSPPGRQPVNVGSLTGATAQPQTQAPAQQRQPSYDELRQEQRSSTVRTLALLIGGLIALGLLIFGGILAYIIFIWYPDRVQPYEAAIANLASYQPDFQTARILDANGELITELNSADGGARMPVGLGNMSPYLIHAIVSSENASFYEDPGYSIPRIISAFLNNLTAGEIVEGASTITQQVAQNLVIQDRSPTADRKLTEILVAIELAQNYSKNEILEFYLNNTFFGNQTYGVEAAAQFYFDQAASELNMAESALLAAILNAPADNNPVVSTQRDQAFAAMDAVMTRMVDVACLQFQHGQWAQTGQPFCINQQTTVELDGQQELLLGPPDSPFAGAVSVFIGRVRGGEYLPRDAQFEYPHFVLLVQEQLLRAYGAETLYQQGYTIRTTLVPRIQGEAQDQLAEQVRLLGERGSGINTGAVMVTDPRSGAIMALVGSPDFNNTEIDGEVDNTRTYQQPGSTIKPILYLAGLNGGSFSYQGANYLTPASILWDVETRYDTDGDGQADYIPRNEDNIYHGPVSLRNALQRSYNVPAVKTLETVGFAAFQNMANTLNLNFLQPNLTLASALGANEVRLIDMMRAYGAIANAGNYVPLRTITEITDSAGNQISLEPLGFTDQPTQVISPQLAYLMQNILSDDNARSAVFGLNSNLTLNGIGIPTQDVVAAKTGTTDGGRDLWTLGFTNNRVVGVWLGTVDDDTTVGETGFTAAAPLWNRVMQEAVQNDPPTPFAASPRNVRSDYCAATGTAIYAGCPQTGTSMFIQGQQPPVDDQPWVQQVAIDAWTGVRANNACPNFVVQQPYASFVDLAALNYINNNPAGQNYARSVGITLPLEIPPLAQCDQSYVEPVVSISAPASGIVVEGTIAIVGQATGSNFSRYDVLYTSDGVNFTPIGGATQQANAGTQLAQWDTTTVPNGQYTLRLRARSQSGGELDTTVAVTVQNIPPTATPTPTPSPTPPVIALPTTGAATPIPQDPISMTPTVAPF